MKQKTIIVLSLVVCLFLFITVALAYVISSYSIQEISGQSMYPNYSNGQYYLIKKFRSWNSQIKRGDVVLYKSKKNPNIEYIKRVIGLPGERFRLTDKKILINGKVLDESSYLKYDSYTSPGSFLLFDQEAIIPPNAYIVLGDNRPNSLDSREVGFISKESILGKAEVCIKNCDNPSWMLKIKL